MTELVMRPDNKEGSGSIGGSLIGIVSHLPNIYINITLFEKNKECVYKCTKGAEHVESVETVSCTYFLASYPNTKNW